jgi:hypothetical protein
MIGIIPTSQWIIFGQDLVSDVGDRNAVIQSVIARLSAKGVVDKE